MLGAPSCSVSHCASRGCRTRRQGAPRMPAPRSGWPFSGRIRCGPWVRRPRPCLPKALSPGGAPDGRWPCPCRPRQCCATIPTGVISGCARRSPRPMARSRLRAALGNGAASCFTWAQDAAATGHTSCRFAARRDGFLRSGAYHPGASRGRPASQGRAAGSVAGACPLPLPDVGSGPLSPAPCPSREGPGRVLVTVTMRILVHHPNSPKPTASSGVRSSLWSPCCERFALVLVR